MLAIIIPLYKIKHFEATLQSLAHQTDKRFTVYIGDDASPVDCTSLLQRYEGQFDFIYHRFESNLGSKSLTEQWESCIALSAKEEWFMILGDDDYLSANFVENFYFNYDVFNIQCNVVRYATQVISEIKKETSEVVINPLFESGIGYLSRKISGRTRGSLSEFVFKRSAFSKFGFTSYPSAFYSDDKVVLDLSVNQNIYSINDALVSVRVSSDSLSGKAEIGKSDLFLARFLLFKYLFDVKYSLFATPIKKIVLERLLHYTVQYEKHNLILFLKLYLRSIFFLDFKFFMKINKKIIKLIIGKSIE